MLRPWRSLLGGLAAIAVVAGIAALHPFLVVLILPATVVLVAWLVLAASLRWRVGTGLAFGGGVCVILPAVVLPAIYASARRAFYPRAWSEQLDAIAPWAFVATAGIAVVLYCAARVALFGSHNSFERWAPLVVIAAGAAIAVFVPLPYIERTFVATAPEAAAVTAVNAGIAIIWAALLGTGVLTSTGRDDREGPQRA